MRQPNSQNVVLCHGVFDILHLGHKRHLEEARALGDRLVVSITADQHVHKGAGRPMFTAEQRKEMLLALGCVDDVVISESGTAVEAIERLKPAVFVKGIDYAGSDNPFLAQEVAAVEAHGGRYHVTSTAKWSSSRIINTERLSDDANRYLAGVRDRGWGVAIRDAFARADALNILFVGETIIDEYRYVNPLAKPSKEFILATVEAKEPEQFLGGVVAASAHADWKNVTVVTDDGEPIKKTRFVDADFSRKLFEVYNRTRIAPGEGKREAFTAKLEAANERADVVIVFDFGHGLMRWRERDYLGQNAKFLAVNAQTNAANYGFNLITNYRYGIKLVCIDKPEARLASGEQFEDDTAELAYIPQIASSYTIVTEGRSGATVLGWNEDRQAGTRGTWTAQIPAFSSRAIDTMGAGDAFLAVTAPLVAAGLDLEAAAFVGNVAGAIKTDIVGHRRHVGRDELLQTVEALLA